MRRWVKKLLRQQGAARRQDLEARALTTGELCQAVLNLDMIRTAAAEQGPVSERDAAYFAQQATSLDDELERRGWPRYADL